MVKRAIEEDLVGKTPPGRPMRDTKPGKPNSRRKKIVEDRDDPFNDQDQERRRNIIITYSTILCIVQLVYRSLNSPLES